MRQQFLQMRIQYQGYWLLELGVTFEYFYCSLDRAAVRRDKHLREGELIQKSLLVHCLFRALWLRKQCVYQLLVQLSELVGYGLLAFELGGVIVPRILLPQPLLKLLVLHIEHRGAMPNQKKLGARRLRIGVVKVAVPLKKQLIGMHISLLAVLSHPLRRGSLGLRLLRQGRV